MLGIKITTKAKLAQLENDLRAKSEQLNQAERSLSKYRLKSQVLTDSMNELESSYNDSMKELNSLYIKLKEMVAKYVRPRDEKGRFTKVK